MSKSVGWCERIIRVGTVAALAAVLPACIPGTTGGGSASSTASGSRQNSAASPSPSLPASVWVLTPEGANLRADANKGAQRVLVVTQAAQLDVTAARTTAEGAWLQVRLHDSASAQGWVFDDPGIVTRTPIQQAVNPAGYTLAFPQSWVRKDDSPNLSTFSGGHQGHSYQLAVQTSDDTAHLM